MSGETGSLRYMAPEVAASKPYNHKVDVYSFGKVSLQLLLFYLHYDFLKHVCCFFSRRHHAVGVAMYEKTV